MVNSFFKDAFYFIHTDYSSHLSFGIEITCVNFYNFLNRFSIIFSFFGISLPRFSKNVLELSLVSYQ